LSAGYNGESVPSKAQMQCDLNEYFDTFSDAILLYESKDQKTKIAIELELDRYSKSTYFTVYSNSDVDSLWVELKAYCKKNSPYKNKKIDALCSFLDINKDIGWDDVLLDPKILKIIKGNVTNLFSIQDTLRKNKISLKRGVILAGKPGCVIRGTKIKVRKKKEGGQHNIINI